jgi:hypothetical protein
MMAITREDDFVTSRRRVPYSSEREIAISASILFLLLYIIIKTETVV